MYDNNENQFEEETNQLKDNEMRIEFKGFVVEQAIEGYPGFRSSVYEVYGPNGRIRFSTPDLDEVLDYLDEATAIGDRHENCA